MLFKRIFVSLFLSVASLGFAYDYYSPSATNSNPFGQVLEPGESMVIWSEGSFDCGFHLRSVRAEVSYEGAFSGVLALVLDGEIVDQTRVNPRQNYASFSPFGNMNVLCHDIQQVELANVGKDSIFVGNSRIFLGARKRL